MGCGSKRKGNNKTNYGSSYFCTSIGKVTTKMIKAYTAEQEKAKPQNILTVADGQLPSDE